MARKNNNALFFTCSLIEYIGRTQKQRRWKVTDYLGMENIKRIYNYADVFHCEPIEKVAAEFTEQCDIPEGEFDNVSICRWVLQSAIRIKQKRRKDEQLRNWIVCVSVHSSPPDTSDEVSCASVNCKRGSVGILQCTGSICNTWKFGVFCRSCCRIGRKTTGYI